MTVHISEIQNPKIAKILNLPPPKEKKKRKASRRLEDSLQKLEIKWFDLQYPTMTKLLFAIPNGGGYRHIVGKNGVKFSPEGKRMKEMGTRKGVLDLLFMEPRGSYTGLWIENKVEDNEMDKDQKEFAALARARRYKVVEVRTIEQFMNAIIGYLKLSKPEKGEGYADQKQTSGQDKVE